jgi:hypothetical protein
LNIGQGQTLKVTFTPTDAVDYRSVTATATINVMEGVPLPPVRVLGAQWQTLRLSKTKSEKVLIVTYSAPLNPNDAQDLAAYELFSAARNTMFTRRDPLTSAVYNASKDTVTLTPKGGKIPPQPLELEIVAAQVHDPLGRPLAGNGTPGGNYVAILPHGVSAAAVDHLLVSDRIPHRVFPMTLR